MSRPRAGSAVPPRVVTPFLADPWRATLALVGGLTLLHVALLYASPLELYPDEAQYWLWSRRLDLGYFSKPPMIAWLIAATTAVGGDREAWVRLSAPLLHAFAALALHRAAARLYDGRAGFRAAAVYALMPGVQLSSFVIATDAPLLAFLALALWALAALWTAPQHRGRAAALGFGAALGAAALSKYAAFYLVAGLAAHALLDREGRRRLWTPRRLLVAAAAFGLAFAPNVAWNVAHHFQTVAHTAADASLGEGERVRGLDPRGGLGFGLGQFGVFGPVPFALLLVGALALAARRRRLEGPDALLLCLTVPPLVVVLGEAIAMRANANWAAAAYVSGSVLVAGWTARGPARPWLRAGLAVQAAGGMVVAAALASPSLADGLGLANSLKRARGWAATAQLVRADLAARARTAPLSAWAVDDRFVFNALAYYGRDWIGRPGAPPLRMWLHLSRAHNQAEAEDPLTGRDGARVAVVSFAYPVETRWDFRAVQDARRAVVRLDPRRGREFLLFTGEGFAPRPRDPLTGRPVPPAGS